MPTTMALTNDPGVPQDIYFVDGQIAFVTGKQYTAQRIRTRLQLFLGEWPFDTSQGVPWLEQIFVKPVVLVTVEALIKNTILGTPTVTELVSYSDHLDRVNRIYSVNFSVNSDNGTINDTVNMNTLILGVRHG